MSPKGFVTVNINHKVRFRFFGERGEKVWRAYWKQYSGDLDVFQFIPADADGWRETQLHNLMRVIGPSFQGCFTPIETDIQVQVSEWKAS
jgi:hypothetical protein